jgi:hypothetical protein
MRFTKTKLAVAVATTAVVALGSTAAYAYFSTTGSGSGSASAGVAVPLTATITVAGPALVPDSAAHLLSYTITNPASFAQHASAAVIGISGITASAANGGGALNNLVCDFVLTQPVAPSGGYTFPANGSVTVNAGPGTGSIKMVDNNTDQSSCEGATVNLVGIIS